MTCVPMKTTLCTALFALASTVALAAETSLTIESLGEALFSDENLSLNRTQSCATCHDPDHAFADPRGMASLGDDGVSIGDRNAPTAMYAAHIPEFHQADSGDWVGGQFHDGRAMTLEDQAGGPPLNPVEMGMADKAAVVARLRENQDYVTGFDLLFGAGTLENDEAGYRAMTQAIAAYERTEQFSPFDSKYDRYLRGEVALSDQEELGRVLFFSKQFTNCNLCHQVNGSPMNPREVFTDFSYHNIGVPENKALRQQNGVALGTLDHGLAANPQMDGDPNQRGKFRTPTLRNVAVTGPYMHNGIFADLRTVILFYNQYNTKNPARRVNPETGAPFPMPQIPGTLAVQELTHGPALDDTRVDALVAFLKTLTDQRYEHLLED
ncbi:Methylamine utilization protein MauG precursor [Pelagimonas phthalicica]|uniref:Methylamine utilization protein MauG n=2 Tax=Pelagimonas phthalicica TaxID=1037362 RepID=A0A238JF77_9RHOB|nr:cytochrome c peroxidase [Pelagimonas phthalicica]SMX29341.1 Methylamine utilization protein MauG precursor [Pelagimonas phthalicica]